MTLRRAETLVLVAVGAVLAVAVVSDAARRAERVELRRADTRVLGRYLHTHAGTDSAVFRRRFSRAAGHDTVCARVGRPAPGRLCLQIGHRGPRARPLGGWRTARGGRSGRARYDCFGLAARAGLCRAPPNPRSARRRVT